MAFDWKSVVKTVAPLIGTAIGGPFGGMAAKAASMALLGRDDATEDELSLAVQNATPEQLTTLRQSDNDFKVKMKELGISEKKLVFDDKASARAREAAVKDSTPKILMYLLTLMVTATLIGLFYVAIPEANKATVYMIVGAELTAWVAGCAYYHGSSAGSKLKDLKA